MSAMWSQMLLIATCILFVYPFAIYPAILSLAARRRRGPAASAVPADAPSACLVICALNEQRIIRQKLENSIALDYPAGKLRIVVVSDGSTDATAAIAREFTSRGVELVEREKRRGKVANLNDVIPAIEEEIVILSDANVIYDSGALLHLVRSFTDSHVGCVSGKVILVDTAEDLRQGEESYYSIEWRLQKDASALHSMMGADGAMYAFRRKLFRPCPNDTLIEDFVIPMNVLRQGYRVVFEPSARAWEKGVTGLGEEFRRKKRIAAGAAQGLLRGNAWPRGGPAAAWFVFVSHKLLRWLSPVTGILAIAIALASFDQALSRLVLAGAVAVVAAAAVRLATGSRRFYVEAPFYFLFGQAAVLCGLVTGAMGRQSVLWAKQDR